MTQGLAGYQPMARTKQTSPMMMQPNQGLASRAAATPTVPPQSAPQPQSVTRGVSPDPPGRAVVQGGLAGARAQTIGPGGAPGTGVGSGAFQPVGPGNIQNPNTPAGKAAWNAGTNNLGMNTYGQPATGSAQPQPSGGQPSAGQGTGANAGLLNQGGNGAGGPINSQTGAPMGSGANAALGAQSGVGLGGYNPQTLGGGSSNAQFGGVVGGANAVAGQDQTLAAMALQNQGPQVQTGATNYGLNLLGQTAAGGGPAQQAAQAQLAQGTSNALNAGMALANSSRGGGPAGAAAQASAQQGAAGTIAQGATSAAQLQANMAANAQGQFEGAAQSQEMGLAGLSQAQTAQNAQIAQNWTAQGNAVEQAQLAADTNVYSANLGQYENQQNISAAQQNTEISAGAGVIGGGLLGAHQWTNTDQTAGGTQSTNSGGGLGASNNPNQGDDETGGEDEG
jgi:hypothetical protein